MMDEFSSPSGNEKSKGAGFGVGIAVFIFMYFGLLGPCVRVYDDCPDVVQVGIEAIYTPLILLNEYLPGNLLERYAELWER